MRLMTSWSSMASPPHFGNDQLNGRRSPSIPHRSAGNVPLEVVVYCRGMVQSGPALPKGVCMETHLPTTEDEWQRRLSPEQFEILRKKGTERAFTGKYWNVHEDG